MQFHNPRVREIAVHYQIVKNQIAQSLQNGLNVKAIEKHFKGLDKYIKTWADKNVKEFYKSGDKQLDNKYIKDAKNDFIKKMQTLNKSAKTTLLNNLDKFKDLDITDLKKPAINRLYNEVLTREKLFIMTTPSGRRLQLDYYVNMLANGIQIKTRNNAILSKAEEQGKDLVKISKHNGSCKICQKYENKIYSISGNDSKYPKLPFNEHLNLHPNCFHILHIV